MIKAGVSTTFPGADCTLFSKPDTMTLTLRLIAALWLLLCTSLIHAEIEYPTTIGVDIIYPRPEARARDNWLPVVFAIQHAEAAYFHGFTMRWLLYPETGGDFEYIQTYTTSNFEKFHYGMLDSDTAIVVGANSNTATVDPGRYNFTWEFSMVPCTVSGSLITIESGTVVSSGSFFIDVASGDAGNVGDLEDWIDKCPEVGPQVTIAESVLSSCPVIAENGGERSGKRQMCDTLLLDAEQRGCLHSYFSGLADNGREYAQDNGTVSCQSGFDVLPMEWGNPGFEVSTTSSSSSTTSTTKSSSTTTDISTTDNSAPTEDVDEAAPTVTESTDSGNGQSDDDESVSPIHLPGLTTLGGCMAVGFILLGFM